MSKSACQINFTVYEAKNPLITSHSQEILTI